ncbi:MAG: GNAT family N-acetyltransferase [Pseudobdellovibrionaceae bacterium]
MEIRILSGLEAKPLVDPFYERNRKGHQARKSDLFFVATEDQEILGAVRFCVESGASLLRSLVVDEKHQRKGIGKQLLLEFEKHLNQNRIRSVFCLSDAYLQNLYEKIGFRMIRNVEAPAFLQERLLEYKNIHPGIRCILLKRP